MQELRKEEEKFFFCLINSPANFENMECPF